MIFLAVALLLQAQGTPSQPTQGQQIQAQQPTPKPYAGTHTLAKTWGDLYPGLRTPARPVHGVGTGAKLAAGNGPGVSKSATQPGTGSTSLHASGNRPAAVGPNAAKGSVPGNMASVAPSSKPVTSTALTLTSSQMTFFNGVNKSGDGRMDVMHFSDGKMAVTMGKDWNCSYANDQQQHRVVIICDGGRARP